MNKEYTINEQGVCTNPDTIQYSISNMCNAEVRVAYFAEQKQWGVGIRVHLEYSGFNNPCSIYPPTVITTKEEAELIGHKAIINYLRNRADWLSENGKKLLHQVENAIQQTTLF